MTTIDFTPLFRSAIGFDRLASALESAYRSEAGGYPPYNIESTGEDKYQITLAVAGFGADEIEIETRDNLLKVVGKKGADVADRKYLYRGIANRNFERSYQLADYVRVDGADLQEGLLRTRMIPFASLAPRLRRIVRQSAGELGKKVDLEDLLTEVGLDPDSTRRHYQSALPIYECQGKQNFQCVGRVGQLWGRIV